MRKFLCWLIGCKWVLYETIDYAQPNEGKVIEYRYNCDRCGVGRR